METKPHEYKDTHDETKPSYTPLAHTGSYTYINNWTFYKEPNTRPTRHKGQRMVPDLWRRISEVIAKVWAADLTRPEELISPYSQYEELQKQSNPDTAIMYYGRWAVVAMIISTPYPSYSMPPPSSKPVLDRKISVSFPSNLNGIEVLPSDPSCAVYHPYR